MPDQLKLGERAEPGAADSRFATDDQLADRLEIAERQVAEVRRHLRSAEPAPDPCRRACEFLADPENWLGNPHHHHAVLLGHCTPFELARETLGLAA